jgi:hypothetical protein
MKKNILLVTVCMIVLIVLVGCGTGEDGGIVGVAGGGGGGYSAADTMTVSLQDSTGVMTATLTEGLYNSLGYLDPDLYSAVDTTTPQTAIYLCSGYTGTMCTGYIGITATGSTQQTYPTGPGISTEVLYVSNDQYYSSFWATNAGSVTLTSIGNVGEKVTGSFNAEIALVSNPSDTKRISGSFSVTREF